MCGIAGIITIGGTVAPEQLDRAVYALVHRGPDDSGTVILRTPFAEIGLGNRRLAILDLSPLGHQPMQDPATGNWIVYNGEIYNFRAVRTELEAKGTRFLSNSDTEVLLQAYATWGEDFLGRLRGMFAFALWDAKNERLFIARDPMGIKPLYYYAADGKFLFSSEIRSLLATGLVPRKLDAAGLFNYLTFGSAYDPITMIEGVTALEAGHTLTWAQGRVRKKKYWSLLPSSPAISRPLNLRAELEEAVRLQLVSDVPVGVFLSGGIDSSGLVALLSRSGNVDLNTFSIVFKEAEFSEQQFSREVATRFKTQHHELLVSQQDFLDCVPAALQAMDQPTMDGLNTFLISRKTREAGVKVVLSGLGGDEMFAGYSSFRTVPEMERFARRWKLLPKFLQKLSGQVYGAAFDGSDRTAKLSALMCDGAAVIHPYFLSRMLFLPQTRNELLGSNGNSAAQRAARPLRQVLEESSALDAVNRVSYLESRCYMLNTLLRDSDVMSMAHGLELRVPLIDHKLAEAVMRIPGSAKINAGIPKPLFVKALGDDLPANIVHRPKRGFTLPLEDWLRDTMRPQLQTCFDRWDEGPLQKFVHGSAVRKVWDNYLAGKTSWSRPWALFVLQRWCELHL